MSRPLLGQFIASGKDNVDMPSILPEFLTICVRSALRCRDGCLTGALGDDMCYSRTVHCMATRRYQMAPAVDARCQDFYWGSSELTSYKDWDLRQKLESTARERGRVQNIVSRLSLDLPLTRKQNAFKSVWYQGHIGQAIIWPYNLPRPLFQIRAHLSTFYPTPVLGPKIVALFFSFAATIEMYSDSFLLLFVCNFDCCFRNT